MDAGNLSKRSPVPSAAGAVLTAAQIHSIVTKPAGLPSISRAPQSADGQARWMTRPVV